MKYPEVSVNFEVFFGHSSPFLRKFGVLGIVYRALALVGDVAHDHCYRLHLRLTIDINMRCMKLELSGQSAYLYSALYCIVLYCIIQYNKRKGGGYEL